MPVLTRDYVVAAPPAFDRARRRFAVLAGGTAIFGYFLIVFGGLVRITGSGLGCGDHWPLCNGHILPPWDLPTWIEWTHRLLAVVLSASMLLLAVNAVRYWSREGFGTPRGASRPALLALVLLVVQIALGAITVKLDLPAAVTSVHFINALLMISLLLVAAVRARGVAGEGVDRASSRKYARAATAALVLGFVVVSFGALTANMGMVGAQTAPSGAAWACQGFPLCNGQFMPKGDAAGLVHTHWSHRMFAFLLFFHVVGAAVAAVRRGAPRAITRAALGSAALVTLQVVVAAALVLHQLPSSMRVLHLVVGAALWMTLVTWATRARHLAAQP